ncbi:putative lysosomal amino acid transporter 1 [Apostichopus japonicus]|uniref:Putative lysosomal amino acid transporter 1 n=1 Tax=Stichopus japonicus TaxID=307972 RepID=A0A2G8KK75_STIJA|nr:putative lysosomal amino acid transporter 1 [Apostichopus japonicus]
MSQSEPTGEASTVTADLNLTTTTAEGTSTIHQVSLGPSSSSVSPSVSKFLSSTSSAATTHQFTTTMNFSNQTECSGVVFLGECVYTGKEYFSFIIGGIAIVVWLAANLKLLLGISMTNNASVTHARNITYGSQSVPCKISLKQTNNFYQLHKMPASIWHLSTFKNPPQTPPPGLRSVYPALRKSWAHPCTAPINQMKSQNKMLCDEQTVRIMFLAMTACTFYTSQKKHGYMATGQTIYLFHLLLADGLNLLGAALCGQLGTQVLTAIFLVVCDIIFIFLLTFTSRRQRAAARTGEILNSNWNAKNAARISQNGSVLPVCCLLLPCMITLFAQPVVSFHSELNMNNLEGRPMIGRKLLMVADSGVDNFGFAVGIFAALLYATVRITTIKDSIYSKDVIRPEIGFHGLSALACLVYCSSIVSYDISPDYIINALPWLIGMALLGLQDLFIVFMTWRVTRSTARVPRVRPRVEDGTLLLYNDGTSINFDQDDRSTVSQNTRRDSSKEDPQQKERSDTIDSGVEERSIGRVQGSTSTDGVVSSDLDNQRDVKVQVISYPHLQKTAGPEEDLFMNRQNLQPGKNRELEDDFAWDFSDIDQSQSGKWNGEDWDEETVLKEIEDELRKADEEEEEMASTPSLSYNSQQELGDDDDMYHVM